MKYQDDATHLLKKKKKQQQGYCHQLLLFLSFAALLSMACLSSPIPVFGHGLGLDTIPAISIDNEREISVTVEIPSYYEQANERQVTITATDLQTGQLVPNVTYLVGLFHDNQMIFRNYFFTETGDLSINVKSNSNGNESANNDITITGAQDSLLNAWYHTPQQPLEITGPVFGSGADDGGLYTFEIEIRTIDEPTNIVENLGVYTADITIVGNSEFIQLDESGNDVTFGTRSYFDAVDSFTYDPINKVIRFEMPFDWSQKRISHIPVVHQEVHFPKDFVEFLSPGYSGTVNDIPLFKSSIAVDDYTEDSQRLVHFVLLQDHLKYLKNQLSSKSSDIPDKMIFTLEMNPETNFPISAWTRDESFQVDLSWDPAEISTEDKTKFIFTIRDAATAEPLRNSNVDFVIIQNEQEIYRETIHAQIGGNFIDYTFTQDQTGPITVRFENIRGTGQSTEFGILVVPEFGIISLLILAGAMSLVILVGPKYLASHRY